jgi:hypothetical protein
LSRWLCTVSSTTRSAAAQQLRLRLLVVADGDIQRIDALARQGGHALRFDFGQGADLDQHRLAGSAGQVFLKAGLQLGQRGEHGLVQRVEVQLERLGFDDVRRIAGMANSPMATTGLPDGSSQDSSKQFQKSTPCHGRASPLTPSSAHLAGAESGTAARGVGGDVFAGLAQRGVFGGGMHGN